MKILIVILVLLMLLLPVVAYAEGTGSVKVISKDGTDITKDNHEEGDSHSNFNNSESETNVSSEVVDNEDFLRNEVAAGNKQFMVDLVTGMYDDIWDTNNTDDENVIDNTYKILTLEPHPYDDKTIVELYGGYLNLAVYLIVLFILGESISRNIDRMEISFGTKYHIPKSKFLGGIALCLLSMMGHVLFGLSLDIIEAFNDYIITPVIPSITPDPDNILTFLILGLCELLVGIFFKVRYYLIYVFAVICSVIIVLLVPKLTRGFAVDVLEKMSRILIMQPAALFVMSICLMTGDDSILGYIGLVVLIFLTCYYCMFGNFTLLKTAFSIAVTKGLAKSGVRFK